MVALPTNPQARVTSGSAGLDAMLNGGFVAESSILVRGAPGTGKTTLALQYLIEGVKRGENGLFISFEEFPTSLYNDAASLGWDLRDYEQDGKLTLIFTSPEVFYASLSNVDSPLMRVLLSRHVQRVAIDSLTHLTRLTGDSHQLRHRYNTVINAFNREGITAMFLGEEMRADFTDEERGRLPFVVDCIILMRYLEIESAVQRAILVLKMRSSDHDKLIHAYHIGAQGIIVTEAYEGHNGLLNGISRQSIISTVQRSASAGAGSVTRNP